MHTVSIKTIILVLLFIGGYMFFIVRKTARGKLDLYDFIMLSTVAIIPGAFAVFPGFADWVAEITGVGFPFVVMFGVLFAVLFIFIHRLTVKIHRLESESCLLLQELSLLRETIENKNDNKKRAAKSEKD